MLMENAVSALSSKKTVGVLAALSISYVCSMFLLDSPWMFMAGAAYAAMAVLLQNRIKAAMYCYLFTVFFIPPTIGIQTQYILLSVDRLVLTIILSSWGIMVLRQKVKVTATPIDISLIIYLAIVSVSVLWNIDSITSNGKLGICIKKISTISLERILIVYLITSVFKTKAELNKMLSFIIVCLSIMAAYGIYESAVRDNVFLHIKTIDNPEVVGTAHSEAIRFGLYRAKSTQLLPHIFGTALCMILPLTIYYLLYRSGKTRRLVAIAVPLASAGIVVTYTRGVYMACGLGMSLSFLALRNISKKMMFMALVGCMLFVALSTPRIVFFCSEYIVKLLNPETAAFDRDNSIQGRISDYSFTANRTRNQLLLGQGYGTYDAGVGLDQYLDNAYLYVLIETGIAGMMGFLFLIYCVVFKIGRILIKNQHNDSDIYMCRFIHIGLIVFFFQCLTYDAFVFAGASKLFWVLLGILLAFLKLSKQDTDLPDVKVI